jgi:hypothetical protein
MENVAYGYGTFSMSPSHRATSISGLTLNSYCFLVKLFIRRKFYGKKYFLESKPENSDGALVSNLVSTEI